jgi:hypothetical protein
MSGPQLASRGCLDPNLVYLSPLGRRCRYVPTEHWGDEPEVACFVYDDGQHRPDRAFTPNGFQLTRGNWRILRQLASA